MPKVYICDKQGYDSIRFMEKNIELSFKSHNVEEHDDYEYTKNFFAKLREKLINTEILKVELDYIYLKVTYTEDKKVQCYVLTDDLLSEDEFAQELNKVLYLSNKQQEIFKSVKRGLTHILRHKKDSFMLSPKQAIEIYELYLKNQDLFKMAFTEALENVYPNAELKISLSIASVYLISSLGLLVAIPGFKWFYLYPLFQLWLHNGSDIHRNISSKINLRKLLKNQFLEYNKETNSLLPKDKQEFNDYFVQGIIDLLYVMIQTIYTDTATLSDEIAGALTDYCTNYDSIGVEEKGSYVNILLNFRNVLLNSMDKIDLKFTCICESEADDIMKMLDFLGLPVQLVFSDTNIHEAIDLMQKMKSKKIKNAEIMINELKSALLTYIYVNYLSNDLDSDSVLVEKKLEYYLENKHCFVGEDDRGE